MDHFYLYDNESEDNLKEILQPYIDDNIVDYEFVSGKCAQMMVYNEAVQNYKFFCRYMAFLDADEFIYPQENKTILSILEEIINFYSNAAALVIHRSEFGSDNQEYADYSKDVIERFLRHENGLSEYIKTIANPRNIHFLLDPHYAVYFSGKMAINEQGTVVPISINKSISGEKIVINHYNYKSKEEYINKIRRGDAYFAENPRALEKWNNDKYNEVYDEGILKYRAIRQELQKSRGGIESAQQINQRRFNAIIGTLSPLILSANLSLFDDKNGIFYGKIHLFLTCWAVSRDLKTAGLNEQDTTFFEELSLKCLYKSLLAGSVEIWQLQLLIDELPKILSCKYSIVNDIKETVISIIPQFMNYRRMQNNWTSYKQLDYLLQML